MSVAECRPSPAAVPPRRLVSTRFLRSELRLIFGRRRNWVGLAVLAAVPVIIAVAATFVAGRRSRAAAAARLLRLHHQTTGCSSRWPR